MINSRNFSLRNLRLTITESLQGMFARRFSSGSRLGLGVRIWDIDYSGNKDQYNALDLTIYGLMIGYEFN